MTTTYFLFGVKAVSVFDEVESVDEFIDEYLNNNFHFTVFKATEGEITFSDLLAAYDGWGGYTEINEEEYNTLSNI